MYPTDRLQLIYLGCQILLDETLLRFTHCNENGVRPSVQSSITVDCATTQDLKPGSLIRPWGSRRK